MTKLTTVQGVEVKACGITVHLIAVPVTLLEEATKTTDAIFRFHYVLTGFADGAVLAVDDLGVHQMQYVAVTEADIDERLEEMGAFLEHALSLVELTAEKVHVEPRPYEYLTIFIAMIQKHGFPFSHKHLTPYLLNKIRKVMR